MALKSADLAVAIYLAIHPDERYEPLAEGLGLSLSAAHRAVARLLESGLLLPGERRINKSALVEFLAHGARYAFPAELGPEVRGVPTANAMPDLRDKFPKSPISVWPDKRGTQRGQSVSPLYPGAPEAAARRPDLHRVLALVDVLRIGQARERRVAERLLKEELAVP